MAKKKTIRIGVGTPESPKSTLWSITVSGFDVYMAQRFSYSLGKISLHNSGKWRFAANSEVWNKLEDRALLKWDRPNPVFDSWILGPTIVFPPLFIDPPLSFPDQYNKKIYWLEPPTEEQERVVLILFSKGVNTIKGFLERNKLNLDWEIHLNIRTSERNNADTVWIISWIEKLRDFTKNEIAEILKGMKVNYKKGSNPSGIFAAATPVYPGTKEDRDRGLSPTVIEVILGENNFEEVE